MDNSLFINDLNELAELADETLLACRDNTIARPELNLIDLCYKILYVYARAEDEVLSRPIEKIEVKETKKKEEKGNISKIKEMLGANATPAQAVPEAPKVKESQSATPATNKGGNQKYISNKWEAYFDGPFVTIYERHCKKKDGGEWVFYSTLTKTGEQMDVCFGGNCDFESLKNEHATIIPTIFEIQKRNAFAKLYVIAIGSIGGDPIEIK